LRSYLEQIAGKIPDRDWNLLEEIIQPMEYPGNQHLIEEGKICRHIWFLEKGALRMFEYMDGNEKTTHFFLAPTMFTMYHSLITSTPSEVSIKTEEDCILQALPYAQLIKLYDQSHRLERIGRIMAEFQFVGEFNRRRLHLNMDALQRYEYLEQNQPEVFQRFQLKDIATYLGITPVSLSRLRKYRSQKEK
jgi:CRP-like cAMP-binding protein